MTTRELTTFRLLQLIRSLSNKATELEGVGVKLVMTDELIEQVASVMFEINGLCKDAAGNLYISLADYIGGSIEESDFMSLIGHQVQMR